MEVFKLCLDETTMMFVMYISPMTLQRVINYETNNKYMQNLKFK